MQALVSMAVGGSLISWRSARTPQERGWQIAVYTVVVVGIRRHITSPLMLGIQNVRMDTGTAGVGG